MAPPAAKPAETVALVLDQGVAVLDVAEVAQHRFGRVHRAVGAEVPLQVANPQHEFRDGGGAGIDFEAEELVRVTVRPSTSGVVACRQAGRVSRTRLRAAHARSVT
jgi:hypothetical protein